MGLTSEEKGDQFEVEVDDFLDVLENLWPDMQEHYHS